MRHRRDLAILGVILLGAAFLRFLWLDRYPIGWNFDESLMGVMASEIYHGLNRPIFFTGFHGNEALYPWLGAFMIWLFGGDQGVIPFRVLSALAGLATIVLAYLVGQKLFDRRVGLIGAALLATNFWQVMSSRTAYRSVLQPLTEAIAVYCLWRGLQHKSIWWWAASGAALGLTLYTYLGGRAFPAVFIGYGIWALLFIGRPDGYTLRRMGLLALAALAVVAPLAIFFALNPALFWPRLEMVFVFNPETSGGRPIESLLEGIRKYLGMFTFAGDPFWRYNIPFRPVFIWIFAPFFFLGFFVLLYRFLRKRDEASAMMLAWLSVMSFPSVLSVDEGGYWLRAMGVVPAVYLLPAIGMVTLYDWARPRLELAIWRRRAAAGSPAPMPDGLPLPGGRLLGWGTAAAGLVALMIVYDGTQTFQDYFFRWGPSFGAAFETDYHVLQEAKRLEATGDPEHEETFAGSDYYGHPIVAQFAPRVYGGLRWFDGSLSFVYSPQSDRPSRYVLNLTTLPDDIDRYLPREALIHTEYYPVGLDGNPPPPAYVDYRLTPEQVRAQVDRWLNDPATRRVNAQFGGEIEALGSQYETFARAGERLRLEVGWRVLAPTDQWSYAMFAHLVDDSGRRWAQRDANGYPPPGWQAGDIILGRLDLQLPEELPSGRYWIVTGVYNRESLQRLEGFADGVPVSEVRLGAVRVIGVPPNVESSFLPTRPVGAAFQEGITLHRADWVAENGRLDVAFEWTADRTPSRDYTVFVQLLDAAGQVVAQSDAEPAEGRLPTSLWLPEETIPDRHRIDVTRAATGRYRLIAGLYHLPTGERLLLTSGESFVDLGEVALP